MGRVPGGDSYNVYDRRASPLDVYPTRYRPTTDMGRVPGGDIYEVPSRRGGPPRLLEREPEVYFTRYGSAAPVTEVKTRGNRKRVVISCAKDGAAGAGPARVSYPGPMPIAYGGDNEYGLGLSAPRPPNFGRERFRPARPPPPRPQWRSSSIDIIRPGRRRWESPEDGKEASIPKTDSPPASAPGSLPASGGAEEDENENAGNADELGYSDADSEIYLPKALEQHGISDPSFETSSDSVPPKEGLQYTSLLRPSQNHAIYNSTWVGSVFDDSEIGAHLKTLSTPPRNRSKPIIQWQHLERPLMSFDEFVAASQIALSLSEIDKKHVRDLLRRAQKDYEKQRQYGRDLEPVCVGDVDYTDDGPDHEKRTASACFFSLPFFSLQRYDVGGIKSLPPGSDEHPTRPLVQMQTRSLSERRELAQAICQLPSTPKGQLLHVSQVWCLVVNDDTILTCSPVSAKQLQGESIAIDHLKQSSQEEKSVLIRGNSELQFQLPSRDVRSWLDLVAPFADEITDFVGEFAEAEFLYRGQRVTSSNWPSILETANSFPVQLTFNNPTSDWSRFESGVVKAAQHLVLASANSSAQRNETAAPQIFYHGCNGSLDALRQIADALHQSLADSRNEIQREQYRSCPEASLADLQEWLEASQATMRGDQTRRSKPVRQLKELKEKIAVMAMYMHIFFWPADFQHPMLNKFLGAIMKALEGDGFLVEDNLTLSSSLAADFSRLISHKAFKPAHKLASAFHGHETRFYPLPPSYYKGWLRLLTVFIHFPYFKQIQRGKPPGESWYSAFHHIQEDFRSGEKVLTLRLRRNIQLEDYQVCPPAGIAALIMKHFGPNLLSQARQSPSTSTTSSPTIPQIYTDIFLAFEATLIETPLDRSHQTTLRHLQQEFAAILSVLKAQLQILQTFQSNLDEQNRTSSLRSIPQAFRSDEGESRMASVMGTSEAAIAAGIDTFRSLQGRATELGEWHLAEMETNKDRQEGAILVFTIVTIVFLPLSFVSSVLGMNTSDIRDMNFNQWVYWASAIPLTILVAGGSLWWVGAFEDWGRWFGKSSSLNVSGGGAEYLDEKMAVDSRRMQGSSGRERYVDAARPVMRRTTYPHREDYV